MRRCRYRPGPHDLYTADLIRRLRGLLAIVTASQTHCPDPVHRDDELLDRLGGTSAGLANAGSLPQRRRSAGAPRGVCASAGSTPDSEILRFRTSSTPPIQHRADGLVASHPFTSRTPLTPAVVDGRRPA